MEPLWILLSLFGITVAVDNLEVAYQWKELDFDYPSPADREEAIRNGDFIPANNLPLGLEVHDDRVFVTVPRWKKGVAASLAYIKMTDPKDSPKLRPYPNWEAHNLTSGAQLSECVGKIIHPPITSYYKFRYNTTLKYPSLTVCRRPSYKTYLFHKFGVKSSTTDLSAIDAFKTFDFENHSLEEFLNVTTFDFEETIPLYGYNGGGMSENIDVKKSFYPSRGQCHIITPKENVDKFSISTGYWFYLKHTTRDKSKDNNGRSTSGFEIHIHNEHDVIKEETAIDTEFVYLESSEDMFVTLSVQTYSQISTSEQPCSTDSTYTKSKCEESCWHNAIAEAIGCTMPWLRNLKKIYPECGNYSQMNEIGNLFSDYRRKEFLEQCYCPISCNNSIYKYHIESRKECDAIQAPSSTINIYFPSNLITDLSEVVSYDWNIFLADVGGSLGFLLGLSVIGIVRVLEDIFKMVFRKKQKKEIEETKKENEEKLPYLKTDSAVEGESLKSIMEFMVNCDMYQHMREEKMNQKDSKKF